MTRFEEGQLAFVFGEQWNILKLDAHPAYRHGIEKIQGTKAVDFVGMFHGENLYFIEVKDFRAYRVERKTTRIDQHENLQTEISVADIERPCLQQPHPKFA